MGELMIAAGYYDVEERPHTSAPTSGRPLRRGYVGELIIGGPYLGASSSIQSSVGRPTGLGAIGAQNALRQSAAD